MKKIFLIAILLFQITFIFGQSSGTVFNQLGIKVSYSYQRIGTEVNNVTSTRFAKYKLSSTIQNNSGKYFDVKGSINFDYMNAMQLVSNESDKTYIRNNSLGADLDHVFCGQKCTNYPNDGIAHLFVICPNSTSNCEKTFVIPETNSGSITINWSSYTANEISNDQTENNTSTSNQTTSTTSTSPNWSNWQKLNSSSCDLGIEISTWREERMQLNYQLWFHYKVRNTSNKNIRFTLNLNKNGKKEFSQPHILSPGGEDGFTHKMSGNYINGVSAENVINTVTNKSPCDENDTSNNQTNTANNSQSLIDELNSLCTDLQTVLNQENNTNNSVYNSICKNSRTYQQNEINLLKSNIAKLKSEISRLDKTAQTKIEQEKKIEQERQRIEKEKQAEEERIRKEQEAKKAQFDDAIQNGDNAFGNKEYDNAMNYYSQAKNYAQNDSERTIADSKYNKAYEAKRTAAREERLEKQKERDQKEDLAYTAAATGMLGAMALVNDRYTHKVSSGKLQFGLGYDQTPMITNQNNSYAPLASYADKASYPTLFMALRLEFLNNKPVNLNLRGLYSIGIQAFDTGVSGGHVVTGFDGGIQFWYTTHTKIKLFADFGSYTRVGDRVKDKDAVNSGTTATDDVREGEYNYKVFRYGGGPMFHSRHDGKETWIKTGMFLENISFAENAKKTMCFSLTANIESELIIEFNYSKNYPVAGKINYPDAFTFENQNYFSIKLIRQGNLW